MNDVSYLQSMRQSDKERAEFRERYGLDSLPPLPVPFTPEELLYAHSAHAEYEASMH
jgi:hypothetical protein